MFLELTVLGFLAAVGVLTVKQPKAAMEIIVE